MARLRFDRSAILLLVLLAHGLAWIALQPLLRGGEPVIASRTSPSWRVLAPEAARIEPVVRTPSPREAGAPSRSRLTRPLASTQPPDPPADPLVRPTTAEALPALPPEARGADESTPSPSLNPEATRRAIRASALGNGPAAQQAVEAGAALRGPTASQRLSDQMQQAGRGDCGKGEYAGGGMGVLSLPFLAAAAMRGDCAK